MENRLISMTDFVLDQKSKFNTETLQKIFNYASFLKQPLKLEMFVPCDDEGNILEEETIYSKEESCVFDSDAFDKYQKAKEKVLFEGDFTLKEHGENKVVYLNENSFYTSWNKSKTIENLLYLNLTLTQNAIKQFKL